MRMDPRDWDELRYTIRIDPAQIMHLCRITPRTWRRWQQFGPPYYAVALARSLAGDLAVHGWRGWSFSNSFLWPPGARQRRDAYSMDDVDWIPSARWMIAGWERGAKDRQLQARALAGELAVVHTRMGKLAAALDVAGENYDSLRRLLGGKKRWYVEPAPPRAWRY